MPPAAAPTPIPASAPLLRPDPLLSATVGEDWAEVVVDVSECLVELDEAIKTSLANVKFEIASTK